MRVLMVQTFYYRRGGDSTYMLALSRLLEERGHEVVPFAMEHPQNLPSPYDRFFVSHIDFPEMLGKMSPVAAWRVVSRSIHNAEAARKIALLADEVKPDIVHFHNIHAHLTASIVVPLRHRGIPVVWTLHDYRLVCPNSTFLCDGEICERCLPNRFYEIVIHRCKKGSLPASFVAMLTTLYDRWLRLPSRIDRFIAPSEFLRGKLIAGGFDPARIVTIPNFVDLGPARPPSEKDYFVYIGRLSPEKGIDILIRAVARLGAGKLRVVGTGPEEESLRRLAAEAGGGRVEFLGFRSGEELERLLAEAQFVVLPSRWYENLPFAIMEAFAAGKPAVAAAIGGIPEMVEDGATGYLFPCGDEAALGDALRRMLADSGRRAEMGRRAREKAERLYGAGGHYERIAALYCEAVEHKKR